jgi:hypothetical protein
MEPPGHVHFDNDFVGYTGQGGSDTTILLDSCSTVNLIANKSLLKGIHEVPTVMNVRCNAGVTTTNLQGWLGDFPEPVWYNPNGAANIMSLFVVKKYYRVQYDSAEQDVLRVTKPDGSIMLFTPTVKGLYAMDNHLTGWAHVSTVTERKSEYTKREYRDAVLARKIQNILMFPGVQSYTKIADSRLIANCPIGRSDIAAAERIFGPNLGALKGKTVKRTSVPVAGGIEGVPPSILERYQHTVLAVDIMFVNKIPFLITISRGLHAGTVENLSDRRVTTVVTALERVIQLYRRRGFRVTTLLADPEFEALQPSFGDVSFNLCAQDEHVPEIERFIRTVKDRTRSCYNSLPFEYIPRLMLIRMVANAVFWLNAFPHADGVSESLSPRYLLTGKHLDYNKHVRLEFGAYVQTHEDHTNDMQPRTIGAICLGPSGNEQGGHYFMSLMTGKRLLRDRWTELPMPRDAIVRVGNLGRQQNMPKTLTFADRHGFEIPDDADEVDDDHDSAYDPATDDDSSDSDTGSYTSDYSSDSDAADDDFRGNAQPLPALTAGVDGDEVDSDNDDEESEGSDDDDHSNNGDDPEDGDAVDNNGDDPDDDAVDMPDDEDEEEPNEPDEEEEEPHEPEINIPDTVQSTPTHTPRRNTGVEGESPGVGDYEQAENAGVGDNRDRMFHDTTDEHDRMDQRLMDERYGRRDHSINLRARRPRNYEHLYGPDHMLATFEQPMGELFMTEQMSLKKGLKHFGIKGAHAVVAELRQLDNRDVIKPVARKDLTYEQKKKALNYLMYLKQKRCGRIKARGCADGRKQRDYKTKEETSSPTVTTEAVFLTAVINAQERRKVMTIDIPGAFMHVDIDELIHVRLEGPMAELLTRVDPDKYRTYMSKESGKQVLYVELQKALYGTLQAALLFWENLTEFLTVELGFEVNPYDSCVVNKTINGKQCTVLWHVDDLKFSHVEQKVLDDIAAKINAKYGQQDPIVVHRGDVHDYLGMTIDYSEQGKVKFKMFDYVDSILEETPTDMDGVAITPATSSLFTVNEDSEPLDNERADTYHRLTAKLLYLCKRARPDLQPTVAFLTTRVVSPTVEDWKKLSRGIKYLRGSKELFLTLEAADGIDIKWFIDASFAVHPDMRSHTGNTMSLGKGSVYSTSRKQRINTKSSTEAELVGVDDSMPLVIWTRNFLMAQGFEIRDNVVFQDNQSAMLLETNGRASSGRRTRHINIRYFFVTDRVKAGEVRIEYCPTGEKWWLTSLPNHCKDRFLGNCAGLS